MDTRTFLNVSTLKRAHRTLWGKAVIAFFSFFLLLYLVLFTPWGNLALKPLLEERLSSLSGTEVVISELKLRHNKFHLVCHDRSTDALNIHGGFSLLTLRMYGHYHLNLARDGELNPLPFEWKTSGALSGGIAAFDVMGRAVYKDSKTQYHVQLHRFKLSILDLKTDALPAAPLMHMMDYPFDADAVLYANLHLSGIDKRDIAGHLSLKTRTDRFAPTKIPEDDTNESFDLRKFLADEQGIVKPFNIDLTADISLDEAGLIEQFAGVPLRGNAEMTGFVRGDEHRFILHSHTTLSQSASNGTVTFDQLEPSHIRLNIQHADVASLFHFLTLPSPLEGKLNAHTDLSPKGGMVSLDFINAATVPQVLKNEYNLTQPLIRFNASVNAEVTPDGVHYRGTLRSDLTRLNLDSTTTHDQMLRDLLKMIR